MWRGLFALPIATYSLHARVISASTSGPCSHFAGFGDAASAGGNPLIPRIQHAHHPWKRGKPNEWPSPPNFARHCHNGSRAPIIPSIAQQESQLLQQFFARHPEQRPHARILQRGDAQSPGRKNRRQPSRDARAKSAIGIEKQPASRLTTLPVREVIHKSNHGFLGFIPPSCCRRPRSLRLSLSVSRHSSVRLRACAESHQIIRSWR